MTTHSAGTGRITGQTAEGIAGSIRLLVDRGILAPGDALPPVRTLAADLGVHRNTVVSAYRTLTSVGVAVTRGRGGTSVADPAPVAEEGGSGDARYTDVASGNPGVRWLPDAATVARVAAGTARTADRPVLYGTGTVDPALREVADRWIAADRPRPFTLHVTGGAVDAVERLLAQELSRGDAVALEDPCFLTSVNTVRLAGYRTVPVPVDAEGMTPAGLRAALAAGVRAVVCTPRAHNPTGASLTASRAAELRRILADHPWVLVIEDDHFSLLSTQPYRPVIGAGQRRWALVRSVSKFLGPDLRLAVVACDDRTAGRLGARLSPGTTWVSHLLQRTAAGLLTDPGVRARMSAARDDYARRNGDFVALLAGRGVTASAGDGLNVWVRTGGDAQAAARRLADRGWLVRPGGEFALTPGTAAGHLRVTVHDLDAAAASALADDIAGAAGQNQG